MKAAQNQLLGFLDGRKQFVIPIYQRTYSWTREQCEQLWNDVVRVARDESIPAHFVGSIVYIQDGVYHVASTPQLLVIDGQQRLTTITLLLAALANASHDSEGRQAVSREEIFDYYLINKHGRDEERYKLLLTRSDKDTLIHLIEGQELIQKRSKRIEENYRFFEEQIRRSGISVDALYHGIRKLIIVDISLDRSHDNPQLIFESLNSTGLELSQADLIRNYVLMGLDVEEQSRLYSSYWYPMEQRFAQSQDTTMFDRFVRDYLTLKSKSSTIPNINEVYADFKTYRNGQAHLSIADVVADVYRYARYFTQLALEDSGDPAIDSALRDINTLKVDVAYPFLLEVFDDYAEGTLTRDDFVAILRLVESYVIRRALCDIPTNSLNKTFATLYKEIDKAHYRESVEAAFLLKDSYRRLPTDAEFSAAFVTKNIYDLTKRRQYLLGKLENFAHKEPINVDDYTIEHIMPQNENLSASWQAELGPNWHEVQSKYLHTIGNLTLTGYNSEMSDKPFIEKRDMKCGFRDSHLRLNRDLAELEHWNQEQIELRARRLAELAITIWPAPVLSDDVLVRYGKKPTRRQPSSRELADALVAVTVGDDGGEADE